MPPCAVCATCACSILNWYGSERVTSARRTSFQGNPSPPALREEKRGGGDGIFTPGEPRLQPGVHPVELYGFDIRDRFGPDDGIHVSVALEIDFRHVHAFYFITIALP